MRARHFLALFAAGLTAACAVGCGDSSTGSGGSGGVGGNGGVGGTGGVGGVGGTGGATTTDPTGGSGGTGGSTTSTPTTDKNDSFEEAIDIEVYEPGTQLELTVGEFAPVETDADYYKFTGKKGDPLLIFTVAKTDVNSPDPFADGYPDVVVTLFDQDQKQIAQNDDPIPRSTQDSSLYTVLPADGTYFIKIEEFCQVLGAAAPNCDQAYFDSIVEPLYGVAIAKLDPASDGTVGEPAVDDDMPIAVDPAEYVQNDDGTGYYAITFNGSFKSASDVDVYTFNVANDIPIADGRGIAHFELFPTGVDGNGSTVPTGKIWIEDKLGVRIAQADSLHLDPIDGYPIEAPITFGEDYTLHVESGGDPGTNPFYFVLHYRSGSNPVETADTDPVVMNNNTIDKAELLPTLMSGGGFEGGFISGDITVGDVDYYELEAVPAAGDLVFATCSAQRAGSGLRNLKLTILNGDTMAPIPGATATETADATANLGNDGIDLAGATKVVLKVEATQDLMVLGTYYSCGVVFIPPAAP